MKYIGHQKIIKLLNKSLGSERISQAYLFCGPESVGKFTLARQFALASIKGKDKIDPDALDEGENEKIKFPDLILLVPPSEEKKGIIKEKEIKAEAVRVVLKELLLYPYMGKKRVLIINDAHRMNKTAQNVILKSLEEPNDSSVIILVSHQESLLLSTIKSRCQKINFSLVPEDEFIKNDESRMKFSMGRPGRIFSERVGVSENEENEIVEKLMGIGKLNVCEKISIASRLSEDSSKARKIIEKYIWRTRLKLIGSSGGLDSKKYLGNIESAERCSSLISGTNANARLTLENLLLNLI